MIYVGKYKNNKLQFICGIGLDGVIKIFEAAKKYDISFDALMKLPNWVSLSNRIESIIRLF